MQWPYLNSLETGSRDQKLDQCWRKRSAVRWVVIEVTSGHLQVVRIGRLEQQATANPQRVMRRLDQGEQRLDIQVFDHVKRRDEVERVRGPGRKVLDSVAQDHVQAARAPRFDKCGMRIDSGRGDADALQ